MHTIGVLSALVVLILAHRLSVYEAANHYCIQDSTESFSLDPDFAQTDVFITTIRNRQRYLASQRCSWELLMRHMQQPRQLLLQPRSRPMSKWKAADPEEAANRSTCDSVLSVELLGSEFHATWRTGQFMPKVPLIVPVNSSQILSIHFITGPSEPSESCDRVELSVSVAVAGFCGRNMLLHRSSCHLISDRELAMSDLDGTGLRLAAFSDMEDVRNLMRDNDLRVKQHPNKRPLDLRDPVRIGVFRCPPSTQAFYWKSRSGSCVAEPFNSIVQSAAQIITGSSSAQCASVRVGDSGGLELQFRDCNIPMRSLVSFPQIPGELDAGAEGERCELLWNLCQRATTVGGYFGTPSEVSPFWRAVFSSEDTATTRRADTEVSGAAIDDPKMILGIIILMSSVLFCLTYISIVFYCQKYRRKTSDVGASASSVQGDKAKFRLLTADMPGTEHPT